MKNSSYSYSFPKIMEIRCCLEFAIKALETISYTCKCENQKC